MTVAYDLLEALPVAVYVTDAEGRITYYNEAAAELWGRRPNPGDMWCGSWKIFTPEGEPLPLDRCPMAVTLKEGRPVRGVDALLERPNGERIPFLPFPTPLRNEQGVLTGAINMLVDLRDRQRGHEQAARLAAIVSSSDDAIISKTLDGKITSWNAGAERIFGYTPEEMIGQSIYKLIPSELQDEEKHIIAQLTRGERIDHFETVRLAKDGRRVDISITVSPVRDAAGRVIGASKVARDIGDRKRAEETQKLLINELHHRIKNTLATVQAIATQTLRRAPTPDDFVSSFNGRIQALARAHALLTANRFQGADVTQLVREQILLGSASDNRVSFSGPSLVLEPQAALHLALVLHELGTNARKHGALSTQQGAVAVDWEVRTNGERSLILNWLERGGPKVRAPSSRGFGATLIEQSLQANGGEVQMRYYETGVHCTITLPLAPLKPGYGAPDEPATGLGAHQAVADRSWLAGKAILLVEDEALIAMELVDHLTQAGCTVIGPAHNIDRALALIAQGGFDAALLDANLSGHRVDDIAVALTQRGAPFAFVTGYGREALPPAFREALIVEKPFTPEQVLRALETLLRPGGNVVSLKHRG